ncbi:DNA ligase-like protein [Novymonas esmeraldas]|uniref:DNA ligase n=1 Tax=Novymonas esmeraldas TaxID=1808958 RepID=A0AAW0F3R0_9TRYP
MSVSETTAGAAGSSTAARTPADFAFRRLCRLFEELQRATTRAQRVAALTTLWRMLPPHHSFFPYMRLLLPHLDTERAAYHLKESKLAHLYLEVLALSRRGADAQRLLHWKDPTMAAVEDTSTAHPGASAGAALTVGGGGGGGGGVAGRFSDVVCDILERTGGYQPPLPAPPTKDEAASRGTGAPSDLGAPPHLLTQDVRLGGISVGAANAFLDALATAADDGGSGGRVDLFRSLVRNTTPVEQKWLLRIILKDMHFGMTHQSMLTAFHPSALDRLHSTSDLRYACDGCLQAIRQPSHAGVAESAVFLFHPLRPMLASPVTARKLEELLRAGQLLLEPKYDGERIMLHMDGTKAMYWTRNTKNFTPYYGPKFDAVARAAFPVGARRVITHVPTVALAEASSEAVTLHDCILDGEFLVYDSGLRAYLEFGLNRTFATTAAEVAGVTGEDSGGARWFCFIVFDIVLLNGQSLLRVPLSSRRRLLREVLSEQPTRLEVVTSESVASTAAILAGLEKAVEARLEGVMLKVASSPYVPAERKLAWMKLKPDHLAGLADTVDLVIVGGFYGTKFGRSHVSRFLLASPLRGSAEGEQDVERVVFHTVCRVGTGYTREELTAIQSALDPYWERMPTRQSVPGWLDKWLPAKTELVPDVYVHPRHSLVLEVLGYSFTETAQFRVGITLRFPRMVRVRRDKSALDATSVPHLHAVLAASRDTLRQRLAESPDELLTVTSEKWKRRRATTGLHAAGHSRGADAAAGAAALAQLQPRPFSMALSGPLEVTPRLRPEEVVVSRLFDGYEFCILYIAPGSAAVWREAAAAAAAAPAAAPLSDQAVVEHELLRHGGHVVANPTRTTSLLIANSVKATKVAHWIALCEGKPAHVSARYAATDVVHLQWLRDCIAAGVVLPLSPRYALYASPSLKAKFRQLLDRYDDAWYDPCTVASLQHSIAVAAAARRGETAAQTAADSLLSASRRVRACLAELGLGGAAPPLAASAGVVAMERTGNTTTAARADNRHERDGRAATASQPDFATSFLRASPCAPVLRAARREALLQHCAPPNHTVVKREPTTVAATATTAAAAAVPDDVDDDNDDTSGSPRRLRRADGLLIDDDTGAVYRARIDDDAATRWSTAQFVTVCTRVLECGACVVSDVADAAMAVDESGRWWTIHDGDERL